MCLFRSALAKPAAKLPLVIFSHGLHGVSDIYSVIIRELVSQGEVTPRLRRYCMMHTMHAFCDRTTTLVNCILRKTQFFQALLWRQSSMLMEARCMRTRWSVERMCPCHITLLQKRSLSSGQKSSFKSAIRNSCSVSGVRSQCVSDCELLTYTPLAEVSRALDLINGAVNGQSNGELGDFLSNQIDLRHVRKAFCIVSVTLE